MRVTIDACVLYPTVMREMVLGVAATGAFEPVWSARILEEWARAAVKLGPVGAAQACSEIAVLRAAWPMAEKEAPSHLEPRLWLPDENDIHVLATAVATSSDAIMTLNAKDFPKNILNDEALLRCWRVNEHAVQGVAQEVLDASQRLSGQVWEMRALLKKARLPRLAKALSRPE